ncbi:helix-turn-helix transcriptional regulator [Dysgonomonas sp. 511]|uniref:helix-turn-helix domain-containing protein n=1 Tax=Dysgonomonas sp. 511 TaxID=2302930 RepID=UPI0013D23342|nr:helix-turn-helix transcriptional regulator [Dysgonomonas sp. 511]NDV79369.1 XRE family transcriptional regulator [Dysgonomonas sp. 511]
MKNRIKQIMDYEQLSPSAFADKLQLGRAVVSHILNGRNNPSLDVVTRILSKMNNINPEWLLTGSGNMLKGQPPVNAPSQQNQGTTLSQSQNPPDLFSQNNISTPIPQANGEYRKEIIVEQPKNSDEIAEKQTVIYKEAPIRKINKIIIYYTDNTFEIFHPDNNPL